MTVLSRYVLAALGAVAGALFIAASMGARSGEQPFPFATYVGGSDVDDCDDVAVDTQGYVYLACHSTSPDFPTGFGAKRSGSSGMDAYALKFDPQATRVVYSARLAGAEWDGAIRIAVDRSGRAVIAGFTKSPDFPTTPDALQHRFAGGESDGFVAVLDPGGTVVYSTLLGGSGTDQCNSLAITSDGEILVAGTTWSRDFPGALEGRNRGDGDGFVARLQLGRRSRVQSLVFGGSGQEKVTGIGLDRSGHVFVTGFTASADFPRKAALQQVKKGKIAAFLAKIRLRDWQTRFSTLMSGSGEDAAWAVAVDGKGNPYIAGSTTSADFPTTSRAAQRKNAGGLDAFVAGLSADGNRLLYSTYFGGSGDDSAGYDGGSLKVDSSGNAWFAGLTMSRDLPLRRAFQSQFGGGDGDGFVAGIDASGSRLLYATYFGGEGRDLLEGLFIGPGQRLWVTGLTASRSLSTTAAPQPFFGGGVFDSILSAIPLP